MFSQVVLNSALSPVLQGNIVLGINIESNVM